PSSCCAKRRAMSWSPTRTRQDFRPPEGSEAPLRPSPSSPLLWNPENWHRQKETAMAIELECANVIVRIRALEARYPGGLTAYRDDCPNNSYLQDDHLTRVGFMSTAEAEQYLGQVALRGLHVTDDPNTSDALIIRSNRAPIPTCHWLVTGEQ